MASKDDSSKVSLTFMGPAQQRFDSFTEQARYFLDTYWPHWNDYENPQSYIMPPIFYYVNPDVSDKSIETATRENPSKNSKHPMFRQVIDRGTDAAENLVHDAIYQLLQEKSLAPFVAVRNLNIDRIGNDLFNLFPTLQLTDLKERLTNRFRKNLDISQQEALSESFETFLVAAFKSTNFEHFKKNLQSYFAEEKELQKSLEDTFKSYCFREYDYVLIGPKFGFVAIEVKHSHYTQYKHFSSNARFLPKDYHHGLAQVRSADALLNLLSECTGLEQTSIPIQKVLFTPNLEKTRLFGWIETLDADAAAKARDDIGDDVVLWFKEDVGNCRDLLRKLFTNSAPISTELFEAYAILIAGLSSLAFSRANGSGTIVLEKLSFSEKEAITKESWRIESQDPAETLKMQHSQCTKISKRRKKTDPQGASASEFRDHILRRASKVIILTPEQQAALIGSNRQFLVGAAGTGKTVVMEQKALRLLSEGHKVTVLAAKNYTSRYRDLFEGHGFTEETSRVHSWKKPRDALAILAKGKAISEIANRKQLRENINCSAEIYENMKDAKFREKIHFECSFELKRILRFGHILIDDSLDEQGEGYYYEWHDAALASFILMALIAFEYPEKVLWIALDPYKISSSETPNKSARQHNNYETILDSLYYQPDASDCPPYAISVLKESMRCPEMVFDVAYDWLKINWAHAALPRFDLEIGRAHV